MVPDRFDALFRFFNRVERVNLGPLCLTGVILSVLLVRIVLEWTLEAQKVLEPPASLFLFAAYFSSALAGLFLILKVASGKPALSIAKVLTVFSPILWIPPVWDFVASGGKGYLLEFVFSAPRFESAFLDACASCSGVSPGLRVEVLAACLAAAAFVFWATRTLWKAVLTAVLVYSFVLLQALWPAYLMGMLSRPYSDVFFVRELLSSYALLVCSAIIVALSENGEFVKRIRWERHLHYAGLALFGAVIGFSSWNHSWPGVLLPVTSLLASVALAFEAAVRINDWADQEIDKSSGLQQSTKIRRRISRGLQSSKRRESLELLSRFAIRRVASAGFPTTQVAALLALSTLLGLAAGYAVWLQVVFAFALSVVYSVPPLRLRRHFVPASIILAACSVAVVSAGFSVGLITQENAPNAMPESVSLAVFGFVFLASSFKDIKDAQGDRKAGVFTLASWLGQVAARRVCAFLVLAAALWASFVSGMFWPVGLFFGFLAAFALAKIENLRDMERVVFALEFAFLALLAAHFSKFFVLASIF